MEYEEEAQVAADRQHAKLVGIQRTEDLRAILKTTAGRAFIWTLLEGFSAPTFHGESTHWSAFEEGKRARAIELMDWVFGADPNAYTIMRQEAATRIPRRAHQEQGT